MKYGLPVSKWWRILIRLNEMPCWAVSLTSPMCRKPALVCVHRTPGGSHFQYRGLQKKNILSLLQAWEFLTNTRPLETAVCPLTFSIFLHLSLFSLSSSLEYTQTRVRTAMQMLQLLGLTEISENVPWLQCPPNTKEACPTQVSAELMALRQWESQTHDVKSPLQHSPDSG